jgi:hypothetical protein
MNNNNTSLAFKFIDELFNQLQSNDPIALANVFSIRNKKYKQVYFEDDAKRYLTEKLEDVYADIASWSDVIEYYILARNCLFKKDLPNGFDFLSKSFKYLVELIKDAKEENWQLPVLFTMSIDLRLLAYSCDASKQKQLYEKKTVLNKDNNVENQADEYAQKTAEWLKNFIQIFNFFYYLFE